MTITVPTKRRWIISVLEAVADSTDSRAAVHSATKAPSASRTANGQKGFALRMKAANRPMANAAR